MNKGVFDVRGITPDHCIPSCEPAAFTHICETDKLVIDNRDPDIHEILHVRVSVCLNTFRIVRTVGGKKIVVHAVKHIEIECKSNGIKYVSKFCIPFCTVIFLECIDLKVANVKFVIEDIEAVQTSSRCISVATVLFAFAEFQGEVDDCHCDSGSIRCDIKIKT